MYFVSFETSTKIFSVALSRDEKVLRYRNLKSASVLEDSILPTLDKMLDSAGILPLPWDPDLLQAFG